MKVDPSMQSIARQPLLLLSNKASRRCRVILCMDGPLQIRIDGPKNFTVIMASSAKEAHDRTFVEK
jgi:hypothetical protein